MLEWPRKSRSTSGTGGTWRYWWLCHEFLKFLHYLCFRGWEIYFWYSYWAIMFWWPRKSRTTSGTWGTWRYWWLCLMNFWYFFTIYVFEGEKSISDIPPELPCFGDLENPGQLPVQEVLMILSYEFLTFLHYSCFRGRRIHCWHSYWAAMFKKIYPKIFDCRV